MRGLSGESRAASFSRERDGVGERELRRGWVAPHPSGESVAASIPRERDGAGERELRRGLACGSPPRERQAAFPGARPPSELPAIGVHDSQRHNKSRQGNPYRAEFRSHFPRIQSSLPLAGACTSTLD